MSCCWKYIFKESSINSLNEDLISNDALQGATYTSKYADISQTENMDRVEVIHEEEDVASEVSTEYDNEDLEDFEDPNDIFEEVASDTSTVVRYI
jgi:hypothetical protein